MANTIVNAPITPIVGHVQRAVDFYNHGIKYFAIGHPQPWANMDGSGNEIPDYPDPDAVSLEETIGYKRADLQFFVVPDAENGTLIFKNQKWRICTLETAYEEKARWIWLEVTLVPEDFNLEDYRQIGLFVDLKPLDTIPPDQITLVPGDVENEGVLAFLDNRLPIIRTQNQDERLVIVIEF